MTSKKTRRSFLTLLATGSVGMAGCSSTSSPNRDNSTKEQTDNPDTDTTGSQESEENDDTDDTDEPEYEPIQPEDSRYVENGELTVRPFVDVFGIEGFNSESIDVQMTAMPNPIDDYDVHVYYTPLTEVDSSWSMDPVRAQVYGGTVPEYNTNSNTWEVNGGKPSIFPLRKVQEHGVKIATFTVDSEAAGLLSQHVEDPFETGAVDVTYEEFSESETRDQEYQRVMAYLDSEIPRQGYRYPSFVEDAIDSTEVWRTQFSDNIGSWVSGTGPQTPPYIRKFDYELTDDQLSELDVSRFSDGGLPEQVPFVLTFAVDDPNARYNEPSDVVAQSPTAIPDSEDPEVLYSPNTNVNRNTVGTQMEKNWRRAIGENNERIQVGSDELYQTVDYSDSEDVVNCRVSRISNYGRYSPKFEEFSTDTIRSDSPMNISPEQFVPTTPYDYVDAPLQSAWQIDYTVTADQMTEAQVVADEIKQGNGRVGEYEGITEHAKDHPVIEDVASKLSDVCENINATHPTEEVTVVADFVQYMTQIALDSDPPDALYGMGTNGPQHPVWTLYHQTGDCQDFSTLANSILKNENFGYNPSFGIVDSLSYSRGGADVTHISTAIPVDELGIEDVTDSAYMEFAEEGRVDVQEGAQYEYGGDKYAYIEMSAPFPIGTTYGMRTRSISPESIHTWYW